MNPSPHPRPLSRRLAAPLVGLAALVALLTIGACTDDDGGDETATTTPVATQTGTTTQTATGTAAETSSPTATSTEGTATGTPAVGGETGDPELDAIVQAVARDDVDELVDRTLTQAVPCTTEQGAGGPPQCDEGDDQGTPYEVFPVVTCEGGWTDNPEELWSRVVDEARGLYAVTEAGFEANEWPQPESYLVFHREAAGGEVGMRLHVDADGLIVAYWQGCQAPVEELVRYNDQDLEILAGPFEAMTSE